ncbi:hypothetical protein Mgra_00008841 [Meloidogyne graminicola]|uniref:Nodal modulator 1 n=1 Tax=Meloidogyne graminicola TaxID=189291 RepID=A0A8S9ZER0_9BILA|nr:hypothetical protein Mgra_00008841 [Meloidogyne graminicola]
MDLFYSNLYFLLTLFLIQEISANLIKCEGFVKSFIDFDLSKIQIKLYTSQGNLKYDAECNPQNGYFLIPIYNKGVYTVKIIAPEGYIFDPPYHELDVNDNNDCSGELNFNLIGLKVSGTILNAQDSSLILGLFEQQNGKLIEQTNVDKEGHYSFVTKPGKYVIEPISVSTQCLSQGKVELEVTTFPVIVKPDISVDGHSLTVFVKDEKGNPFPSATVILLSDNEINFQNLPFNAKQPSIQNKGQKWFYEWETDSSGSCLIYCLPYGKYILNANTKIFNIEANFDEKNVIMDSRLFEVTISLKSFNLSGHIFTANGQPFEDVNINLDEEFKTKSDKEGKFVLTDVSVGKHILEAEKEYFEFDKLNINVFSKMESKIIFFPSRVAICGQIISADKLDKISFKLTSLENNELVYLLYTNLEGKFCELFTPGKYLLKPLSSMFLSPNKIKIDLKGPILDLKFIQYKAKISGIVNCFGKCNKILLELINEDGGDILKTIVNPDGTFVFTDVLPSNYKLKIFDDQNIWWEEKEKDLIIQSTDITDLNFTQKGYLLEIQTSKGTLLKYWPFINKKSKNEQLQEFQLKEGVNQLYFKEENKFLFSIESCYEFKIEGGVEENFFKIPSKIPIILTAISSSISAFIQTDIEDNTLNLKLRELLTNEEIIAKKINSINKGKIFIFSLNNSKIGNKYEIIPESNQLLFMPKLLNFEFTGECEGLVASFNSQIGKFIQGKVEPKVENALVKAINKENKTEDLINFTDNKGLFKIGPVWNVNDFNIEIIKEGFIFVKSSDSPQSFTSIKLTQLRIQFFEEKTNIPLSDILVSISGGLNFRSNNITNETGLLKFIGLTPGSYFILPILQEYKFNSSSFSVQINEGEEKELILEAKRIAYSAFGKVSTIGNSKPFKSLINVEAISPECENHQEENLIDQRSGDFRIKGLKPFCKYLISLKDSNGQEIASFPPLFEFILKKENKFNLNFLILPSERSSPIILGEIDFNSIKPFNGFRIILLENNNIINEQLIKSQTTLFFFNLPSLRKEYSINVELINSKQSRIDLASVNFFANSEFNYIRILPKSESRTNDSEIKANYYGLIFILILTLAFLNQSKVKLLLEYLFFLIQNLINIRQNGGIIVNNLISERRKIKKI